MSLSVANGNRGVDMEEQKYFEWCDACQGIGAGYDYRVDPPTLVFCPYCNGDCGWWVPVSQLRKDDALKGGTT